MNIKSLVFATCLMTASLAHAQNLQTIKLPPSGQLEAAQVDENAVARRKLEIENQKLREENAALKQRLENFTSLGGSEVHAYCPSKATSRNTAGAETNCAAGGYDCEPVTGLCQDIVHHFGGYLRARLHVRRVEQCVPRSQRDLIPDARGRDPAARLTGGHVAQFPTAAGQQAQAVLEHVSGQARCWRPGRWPGCFDCR